MERLSAVLGQAVQAGVLSPPQAEALAGEVARWRAAGSPPVDLGAYLAGKGLPPAVVHTLLGWMAAAPITPSSGVYPQMALTGSGTFAGPRTPAHTPGPGSSGSARLSASLRAGPLGAGKAQGAVIGPYRIEDEIARGGMGVVFKARDAQGAPVALKVLLAGKEASTVQTKRFLREAEVMASLDHSGIVRVLGRGEEEGLAFLALEFVDGSTLDLRGLQVRKLVRILAKVGHALEHAHARGLVHRDVKPSNVLLRRPNDEPVVTDFGLVRAMDARSSLTKTGQSLGTPHYMAPEQVRGDDCSPATDVFALGVMLYEGLTGQRPFAEESALAMFNAIQSQEPTPVRRLAPQVPAALERVCAKAMSKQASARYATAGEMARDLEAWLAGRTTEAGAEQRQRLLVRGGVLVLALVAGGGLALAVHRGDPVEAAAAPPTAPPAPASQPGALQRRPAPGPPAGASDPAVGVPDPPVGAPDPPVPAAAASEAPPPGSGQPAPDPEARRRELADRIAAQRAKVADAQARVDASKLALEAIKLLQAANGEKLPPRAREAAEAAVAADPTLGAALFARGAVRAQEGDADGALADLDAAEAAPEPCRQPMLYLVRGNLHYEARRYAEAVPDLERALEAMPDNAGLAFQTAVALRGTSQPAKAIPLLERLDATSGAGWQVAYNLGGCYLSVKQDAQAEAAFRRAIERSKGVAYTHTKLAQALERQDRLDEAEQALAPAFRVGGDRDYDTLMTAAGLRRKRGDDAAVEELSRRALTVRWTPVAAATVARAMAAQGKRAEALAFVQDAQRREASPALDDLEAELRR